MNDSPSTHLTRRTLFGRSALGVGGLALGSMLEREGLAIQKPAIGGLPHFAPKAKRVIYLLMNGGPPHLDMFDYKPQMEKWRGKEIPESVHGNKRTSSMTTKQIKATLPAFTGFKQYGQCGAWVCDFLPRMAEIVDDISFIKSMHTTQVNHAPAITFAMTGAEQPGRPSMGAWLSYGLGSEGEELPGFVVMTSRDKEASCGQIFYDFYWGNGFLPSKHQGVKFRGNGDPVLYIANPDGLSRDVKRVMLDGLAELNREKFHDVGDPEIVTRIAQYEMAYKMQASVPELTDLSKEPQHILDMYGPDVKRQGSFAYNCLMARRLAERGVRFTQVMHAGWDHHRNLSTQFEIQCRDTDAPAAALIKDLKQRGLLEDTLVVWSGEFGRTPFIQGDVNNLKQLGRDHHPYVYTSWLAGAGIKAGHTHGESDDFAYNPAKDPVHVHDLQATIMHLLGIDHERFTFRFQGRDFRLTDIHGELVKGVLV